MLIAGYNTPLCLDILAERDKQDNTVVHRIVGSAPGQRAREPWARLNASSRPRLRWVGTTLNSVKPWTALDRPVGADSPKRVPRNTECDIGTS